MDTHRGSLTKKWTRRRQGRTPLSSHITCQKDDKHFGRSNVGQSICGSGRSTVGEESSDPESGEPEQRLKDGKLLRLKTRTSGFPPSMKDLNDGDTMESRL